MRRAATGRAQQGASLGRLASLGACGVAVLAAGCIVVPVTRDVYDSDCRLMRREVALEATVVGQFHGCSGQDCSVLLATLGIVSAASLVVSGSLAVVGNVVYWLEHEANCGRLRTAPRPAPAPGAEPAPAPASSANPG